jgi:hypothetical protein
MHRDALAMNVRNSHGFRIVGPFGKTIEVPHFVQEQCRRCGAYLPEMPTGSMFTHAMRRESDRNCLRCRGNGRIHDQDDQSWDDDAWTQAPECSCVHDEPYSIWRYEWICSACKYRREHVSGRPPSYWIPDPDARIEPVGSFPPAAWWQVDRLLVDEVLRVASIYADDRADDFLRTEYSESLFDHNGTRRAPWRVTYVGSREDPTGIRLAMARLRYGRRDGIESRTILTLAERAILSSAAFYFYIPGLSDFPQTGVTMDELQIPQRVAPVVGAGRLLPHVRYDAWRWDHAHDPWPWRWREGVCYREGVPMEGRRLATWAEVGDQLIEDCNLFWSADSTAQLQNDCRRIATDLRLWHELRQTGELREWPPEDLRIQTRPFRDPHSTW